MLKNSDVTGCFKTIYRISFASRHGAYVATRRSSAATAQNETPAAGDGPQAGKPGYDGHRTRRDTLNFGIAAMRRGWSNSSPMTEPVANPPIRLIGRHMRQILFDTALIWKRAFGGNLNLGGVALAVWVANVEYSLKDPELLRNSRRDGLTADRFKPIIASHVATTSGFDDETTRRYLMSLVASGFLERSDAGYVLSTAFQQSQDYEDLISLSTRAIMDLFPYFEQFETVDRYLRSLNSQYNFRTVEDLAPRAGDIRHGLHLLFIRFLSKFTIEGYLVIDSSKVMSFVGLAVLIENIRVFNADLALSLKYANYMPVPPESTRAPVSLRRLAVVLDMPLETVRRYVAQLEQTGFVANTGQGYTVPGESLMVYDMAIAQAAAVARLGAEITQMLSDLDSTG